MELLDLAKLSQEAERFDRAVAQTRGIDDFCSSSLWTLPAAIGLQPSREPEIRRLERGYLSFMRSHLDGASILEPLESMWGLASPLIGEDPSELVDGLHELSGTTDWQIILICGLHRQSALFQGLVAHFGKRFRLGLGRPTVRQLADLSEGFDAYLSRRSRQQRKALRQAQKRAQAAGVTVREASLLSADEVLEHMLAIEARSWKGREGVGVDQGSMRDFYAEMVPRLSERGALRLHIASLGELEVGFILGGVRGDVYRGLQFSYDQDQRRLGLGNLLQEVQMRALVGEGVRTYDLGTEMAYKERFSDSIFRTEALLILKT
jgi:hypothetical protein